MAEAKDCPQCGLVNPSSAIMCDCGYSFQTGSTHFVCPNCRANQGLHLVEPAQNELRFVAAILHPAVADAIDDPDKGSFRCQSCGYTFKPPRHATPSSAGRLWMLPLIIIGTCFLCGVIAVLRQNWK